VIHTGKLMHFIPEDNVYVYFRTNEQKTIMVIINANDQEKSLDTGRFKEAVAGFSTGVDVISGSTYSLSNLTIPLKTAIILELSK
jgi:uncharacterized protein with FMN-binding domain